MSPMLAGALFVTLICIQGLPGDNQLMSFHLHARLWLLRMFAGPLIEDVYLWLMHELAW